MLDVNVKDLMPKEHNYVRKTIPEARNFEERSEALRSMAQAVIAYAEEAKDIIPQEMLDKYNELIGLAYQLSDAEYEMFKMYR